MGTERQFIPLRISVLTISDTRTEANDTSGKTLTDRLQEAGHVLADKSIVPDDIYQIRAIVSRWIADDLMDVIINIEWQNTHLSNHVADDPRHHAPLYPNEAH